VNQRATRRCRFAKPSRGRCQANAMASSDFCFFHCPTVAVQRREARQMGGRRNKAAVLPPDAPDSPLRCVEDVVVFMADTINRVRRGQLDPRVGNTVGYLSGVLLKALETGNLERRLSDLESVVKSQSAAGQSYDWDKFEFVQASGEER
jgi:hypothetical protein